MGRRGPCLSHPGAGTPPVTPQAAATHRPARPTVYLAVVVPWAALRATVDVPLACLRREAETCPLPALRSVTARALALTDGLCWESLDRADATTFTRQGALGAELHVLGVCGGLLEDG